MNNLVKVIANSKMEQVVSTRDLHEVLAIVKRFSAWWEDQTVRLSLIESIDYTPYLQVHPQNHQEIQDYHITLDIAKHIAMISGGENGRKVREYFIQVEKAWNDPELVMARSLQFANRKLINFEERINQLSIEKNELKAELEYKSEVISGLLPAMDIYQKRTVLNRVVRHKKADVRARWAELYKVFTASYHVDLKARCEGHNLKESKKSKHLSVVAYAERFGYLDNLYDIAVKLYETDISEIVESLKKIS